MTVYFTFNSFEARWQWVSSGSLGLQSEGPFAFANALAAIVRVSTRNLTEPRLCRIIQSRNCRDGSQLSLPREEYWWSSKPALLRPRISVAPFWPNFGHSSINLVFLKLWVTLIVPQENPRRVFCEWRSIIETMFEFYTQVDIRGTNPLFSPDTWSRTSWNPFWSNFWIGSSPAYERHCSWVW
jgi:hypothetical protein